jgi:hypothetical protein
MENKKYLDKVVGSLVRSTKMDYDKEEIQFPFLSSPPSYSTFIFSSSISFFFSSYFSASSFPLSTFFTSFTKYCKNTFGLTDDEIYYVWNQYRKILINKIENGQ